MRYIGIWYNMSSEVKRDYVDAKDVNDASAKIYAKYGSEAAQPASILTVIPEDGYSKEYDSVSNHGTSW